MVDWHRAEDGWSEEPEIIEQVPVRSWKRRGVAIDLALDRPRENALMKRRRLMAPPASAAMALFCALAMGACGGSSVRAVATPSTRTAPNNASPPKTVIARRLHPSASRGLHPGTPISSGFARVRVFANRLIGFAITDLPRAGDGTYPVATADGGKTWRTDGPVLHILAAQGPLAVSQAGVIGPRIYFAWCGACNMVIDVTADAGKHWWQTFMPGAVLAVLGGSHARAGITAIVAGPTSAQNGRGASLWVYLSTNGRRWTFNHDINAVS